MADILGVARSARIARLSNITRNAITVVAVCAAVGCSSPFGSNADETEIARSAVDEEATDTGVLFNVTPTQRQALERAATNGDADAAYRLSEYWGMAGGESGLAGDPRNTLEEERWLRVAADAGHEPAKLRLATLMAPRHCAAARQILTEIARSSTDPENRTTASSFLQDDTLCETE